jgi:hypothetical protein
MTKTEAEEQLAAWQAASLAVSKGQSYSIGNRSLSRVDVSEIRNMITYWQRVVNSLTATGSGSTQPTVRLAQWS